MAWLSSDLAGLRDLKVAQVPETHRRAGFVDCVLQGAVAKLPIAEQFVLRVRASRFRGPHPQVMTDKDNSTIIQALCLIFSQGLHFWHGKGLMDPYGS